MAEAETKPVETQSAVDRFFGLTAQGTSVGTELGAGLATFLTMAYIMFVNPAILQQAGMDQGAVFVATCLAAAAGSIIMGLYANYPIALAPGMELNAYFAFTMVPELGDNWQLALGVVFVSGLLFLAMSLTPIRAWLVDSIPRNLKIGIAAGIGLFLALIALQNAGIVAHDPLTLVTLGDLSKPQALLAAGGFLVIAALAVRKVPGAIIIGVLAVTVIAVLSGLEPWHGVASMPPSLAPTFLAMDLSGIFQFATMAMVLALLLVMILDAAGTLIGVARQAGFLDEDGRLPRCAKRCLRTPAPRRLAPCSGPPPPPPISRAPPAWRRAAARGSRRWSSPACSCSRCSSRRSPTPFRSTPPRRRSCSSPVSWPRVSAPFTGRTRPSISLRSSSMMPLAYSIATGIGLGFIAYVILKALTGRFRDINAAVGVIAFAFLLKLVFA